MQGHKKRKYSTKYWPNKYSIKKSMAYFSMLLPTLPFPELWWQLFALSLFLSHTHPWHLLCSLWLPPLRPPPPWELFPCKARGRSVKVCRKLEALLLPEPRLWKLNGSSVWCARHHSWHADISREGTSWPLRLHAGKETAECHRHKSEREFKPWNLFSRNKTP